jgi:hypothetical protein
MAAKQKKSSKVGRNKDKCNKYRMRKGSVDGSKRPIHKGSNQTTKRIAPLQTSSMEIVEGKDGKIGYFRPVEKPQMAEIQLHGKKGKQHLVKVPVEWLL